MLRSILGVLFFLVLSATNCFGQWHLVHAFGNSAQVYSIYFLDAFGQPDIGLVGINNNVFRTTDEGVTWASVAAPNNFGGNVTDFAFKDAKVGWCSVSASSGSAAVACYKTVDGGKSWSPLALTGSAGDVYYNSVYHRLFLSSRAGLPGTMASLDDGASWTLQTAITGHNGFAFSDAQNGVLSPGQVGLFFRTTDAGASWQSTSTRLHCWAPGANPVSGVIYAPNDLTSNVLSSADKGVTWTNSFTLVGQVTGCVQANDCSVYFQTSQGLFAYGSVSNGSIGGPGNFVDSRFFLGKRYVYAGSEQGELMRRSIPSASNPILDPVAFELPNRCTALDTFITITNPNCGVYTLTTLSVSDSNLVALDPIVLPIFLSTDSIYRFRIHILKVGSASAHVILKSGSETIDSTVTITSGVSTSLPLKLRFAGAQSFGQTDVCVPRDTLFSFENLLCDSIQLVSAAFEPPNAGFSVTNLPTLPSILRPNNLAQILVLFSPHDAVTSKAALHLRFIVDGITRDTLVTFSGSGLKRLLVTASTTKVEFDTVSPCVAQSRFVYLVNSSCDSLFVTGLSLPSSSPFSVSGASLPTWILPHDSLRVDLLMGGSFLPGNYMDSLRAVVNNGVQEKSIAIGVHGLLSASGQNVSFSASRILVDSIAPCTQFDTSIVLFNHGTCDSIRIDSIRFIGNNKVTVSSNQTLPFVFAPSANGITFGIGFYASSGAVADGVLHIYSRTLDTIIPFHVSARIDAGPALSASVDRAQLRIHRCERDSSIVYFENESCLPTTIDSIALKTSDPTQSQYVFHVAPKLPITLGSHERRAIRVDFRGDGTGDGRATVRIHETSGTAKAITITGIVLPLDTLNLAFNLTSPSATELRPKDRITTSVTFANANSDNVTAIRGFIHSHADFLGNIWVTGSNGWSTTIERQLNNGVQVLATRPRAAQIKAGDELLTAQFQADVADSLSTVLGLDNVVFMPDDPTFMQCVMTGSVVTPSIAANLNAHCGDSLLSMILQGRGPIENIRIAPNPVTSELPIDLSFDAASALSVHVTLADVLGRPVLNRESSLVLGRNNVSLPTAGMPSGIYYLRVIGEYASVTRRIVIER